VAGFFGRTDPGRRPATAETFARAAAAELDQRLRADHPGLYTPDKVNRGLPAVTCFGDVEAGLAGAVARVDVTFTTPVQHNNPMEPHAALAAWDADGNLTVYDSTQGGGDRPAPEPDGGQGHRRDRHHRHRGRDWQRRLPRDRPPHP